MNAYIAFLAFGFALSIATYALTIPLSHMVLMLINKPITSTEMSWTFGLFAIPAFIVGMGCPIFSFFFKSTRKLGVVCYSIFFCLVNTLFFWLIFILIYIVYMLCNLDIIVSFSNTFISGNLMPYSMRIIVVCILLILSLLFDIFGFYRGHSYDIKEMTFFTPKLTKNVDFVHISDVHIGSRSKSHSQKIVDLILPLKPNFVVITGDLTDSPQIDQDEFSPFEKLREHCQIYMCFGNHDNFSGQVKVQQWCEKCGIQILDDAIAFERELNCSIVGVSDYAKEKVCVEVMTECSTHISEQSYNILLHHRPHGDRKSVV